MCWFQGTSGIAGDMALGALIDAGAPVKEIENELKKLDVDRWSLRAEPVLRGGVAGTRAVVETDTDHQPVRTASSIVQLIRSAGLADRVSTRAVHVFETLARAEALVHGIDPADVHFHEVGALDSIIDTVGVCVALELLDIDSVGATHLTHGTGAVRSAHGMLPNPPPAVVELAIGVPSIGVDLPLEMTTPTGAALLVALSDRWGPLPPLMIESSGFGAGSRDLEGRPNHAQVIVGTASDQGAPPAGQHAVQLDVNLDDVTGETLGHTIDQLLAAGAFDVWVTPAVMKKGRPSQVMSVLVAPDRADSFAQMVMIETGSLGVRGHAVKRWVSTREITHVEVEGHRIAIKTATGRAKVEHDDAVRVAAALDLPLREVVMRAQVAHRAEPS